VTPRATERECEDTIIEAAMTFGWRVHAERPARSAKGWRTPIQGHAGFPDLVLVRGSLLWFVELKRKPNKIEHAQQEWIIALGATGALVSIVWVPEGLDDFVAQLAARPELAAVRGAV
jgi:hypothetical protein